LLDEIPVNEERDCGKGARLYLRSDRKEYEDEHFIIPKRSRENVLRFLMKAQGLLQEDLIDCAPQSQILEILTDIEIYSTTTA